MLLLKSEDPKLLLMVDYNNFLAWCKRFNSSERALNGLLGTLNEKKKSHEVASEITPEVFNVNM